MKVHFQSSHMYKPTLGYIYFILLTNLINIIVMYYDASDNLYLYKSHDFANIKFKYYLGQMKEFNKIQ